jgi:hypothetical protein
LQAFTRNRLSLGQLCPKPFPTRLRAAGPCTSAIFIIRIGVGGGGGVGIIAIIGGITATGDTALRKRPRPPPARHRPNRIRLRWDYEKQVRSSSG